LSETARCAFFRLRGGSVLARVAAARRIKKQDRPEARVIHGAGLAVAQPSFACSWCLGETAVVEAGAPVSLDETIPAGHHVRVLWSALACNLMYYGKGLAMD